MPGKVQHPFDFRKDVLNAPWWRSIFRPSTVGTLTAALFALSDITSRAPGAQEWTSQAVTLGVGFSVGYGVVKLINGARWVLVKRLLQYTGWVTQPKSLKTKLWGIALKYLIGKGPHSSLKFQPMLPKQPVPDLDQTLDLWLQVSKQFVNPDEYEETKKAVEDFRINQGPELQKYLLKRASERPNWLYEYWLYAAYLVWRDPIAINNNYYMVHRLPTHRKATPVTRSATQMRFTLEFYELVKNNTLPPVTLMELVPICMNGYKNIFNSVRLPGEHVDSMERYPGNEYVVVIRNGHYFKLDVKPLDKSGKTRILTTEEIRDQLNKCIEIADALPAAPPVAALTSQRRDTWHHQREKLKERNAKILDVVEKSMFMVTLDPYSPKDTSDFGHKILTGNLSDRWFDKCFTQCTFGNTWHGVNVEHTSIDAMVFTTCAEYAMVKEEYSPNGDVVPDPDHRPRTLPTPQRYLWELEYMKDEIDGAAKHLSSMSSNLQVYALVAPYGKGVPKKARLSPDGYFQMAMQLAYVRMHGTTPKTYEPSTGRLFLLGRTETVHPGSEFSQKWVKAMDDPHATKEEKVDLLRKSVKYQSDFRLTATVGQGCDRHMLGMLCASREMGMDLPQIFRDKAFVLPYTLSTSQTPNKVYEYGIDLDLKCCMGGFGPTCQDGYGIAYGVLGDEINTYHITSWKTSKVADAKKLGPAIEQAFYDMKELL